MIPCVGILGRGSTEARAVLAGILATATVAGQTHTYAAESDTGAFLERTWGVPHEAFQPLPASPPSLFQE